MKTEQETPALTAEELEQAANQKALHENAVDDLLIHAWVSQLILEASGLYVSRQNARTMPMQTGQALLAFLQIFGNVKDEELHRLIQSLDRKSTRLNSSHGYISYAVFCLKKKNLKQ